MEKIHVKPSIYALYFLQLKEIALKYGYNLVIHGSMNRDMDLIAIPWEEEVKPYEPMLTEFADTIGGSILEQTEEEHQAFANKYHGRRCYIINVNRAWALSADKKDPLYYLDISVIPTIK
jgi:hypothetical protein